MNYILYNPKSKNGQNEEVIKSVVKEYEEKMAEPFSTWYKQHLYYDRTVRYLADSSKEKFIDEYEEKVRYRRYGELKNN